MERDIQSTDHQLMVAVARGDLAGMSEIYERKHRNLFRFFYRLTGRQATSEDLVHEVFLRMIRYRHTYERDAVESAEGNFESWMYRIARNVLTDQSRRHHLETPALDQELELHASSEPTAFDNHAKRQELALLHRAISQLPEDKRELIVLSRFQGLSYDQISRIVGCEVGTLKVRVFRAMREMSRIYMELEQEKAS